MTAIGVGLGPRNRIHEAARQDVLDAAAELQVRRRRVAEAPAGGDTPDGEIVAHGYVGTNDWMRRASAACSELLSVPPAATVAQLPVSLPDNRTLIAREAVLASSFPAVEAGQGLDHLTERQRRILALLAADVRDESIAAALGVSVRTVRADIAGVLNLLGVRSRFAAGLRVRRQVSPETTR